MGFKIPTVEKCCCCLPLAGSWLVLAFLSLIFLVLYIIGGFVVIFGYSGFIENFKDRHEIYNSLIEHESVYKALAGVAIVVFLISLVIIVFFIMGIQKKRPSYVLPTVILAGIDLVLAVLGTLAQLTNPSGLFPSLIGLALTVYIFICLYSLYKSLGYNNVSQNAI